MNKDDLKRRIQAMCPFSFKDALCTEDIDTIIDISLDLAFSKYEKIEHIETSGSTTLERAISVTKVVVSAGSSAYDVFRLISQEKIRQGMITPVKFTFDPSTKLLLVHWNEPIYVEYIVDPSKLTVEDLNTDYLDWVIKHAVASLKIKEGYMGTAAVLTELPFEFNYESLKSDGQTELEGLKEELEDKYFGLFAGKA